MLATSGASFATPIDVFAGGNLEILGELIQPWIQPLDSLNINYTFDSDAAPEAGSTSSIATFAASNFSFGAGAGFGTSPNATISIVNQPGADRYFVSAGFDTGLVGPDVGGLFLFGVTLDLIDDTGTVFDDALVLPTSLTRASFSRGMLTLVYGQLDGGIGRANVHSLDFVMRPVDEPGALGLFGFGLALLAVACRTRSLRRMQ